MSFRIAPYLPLADEVRRIAAEQLDRAAKELRAPAVDRHEAIHDVRKRVKKLRALLRLVRSGDEALCRAENARLRDLARALSSSRDRTALIEAAGGLAKAASGDTGSLRPILATLEARRDAAFAAEGDLDATIAATLDRIDACGRAIEAMRFDKSARKVLGKGYALNHARARRTLRVAQKSGAAADLHEFRKRAKDHMHHLSLLADAWPEALKPLRDAASTIADDLGRDHDYALLLAEIAAEPAAFGVDAEREAAVALVAEHGAALRAGALRLARRFYAQKPETARRHLEALWREAAARGG